MFLLFSFIILNEIDFLLCQKPYVQQNWLTERTLEHIHYLEVTRDASNHREHT